MSLPARLQVVVIGVRDLAATRRFYENLGWRSRPRDGLFARFELDGAALVLFPRDTLAETTGVSTTDGFGGTTPAMVVDDAQALNDGLQAVVEAGGRIVAEPANRPWGVRTAYFADPENNIWELCVPPAR
jgi:catechol 2,3-dioxygenase-like lactoylglutathione lyase family enzyme